MIGESGEYVVLVVRSDGREVEHTVKGVCVGRFGVRRSDTRALVSNDGERFEIEPWYIDHLPSKMAIMVAATEAEAMRIADDMSRFSASDPTATDGELLFEQLGPKVDRWLRGTMSDPPGERRGLRQWEADQESAPAPAPDMRPATGPTMGVGPSIDMIVIYDHPKDFPDSWVVRAWKVFGNGMRPNAIGRGFEELEAARAYVVQEFPGAKLAQGPGEDLDPVIYEVYMATIPPKYQSYYDYAITADLSDSQARALIADFVREDEMLAIGKCPYCGRAITKKLDPRQAGSSSVGDDWFNYRCACGCMIDRKEGQGA